MQEQISISSNLKGKCEELTADNISLTTQISDLKAQSLTLNENLTTLQTELSSSKKSVENLSNQLKNKDTQYNELNKKYKENVEVSANLEKLLNELKIDRDNEYKQVLRLSFLLTHFMIQHHNLKPTFSYRNE